MRKLILRMLGAGGRCWAVACARGSAAAQATAAQAPAPQPIRASGGRDASDAPTAATFCGTPVAPPATLPPADSGPVIWVMGPCFPAQGNVSTVEPQTYLYYIQLRPSQPSQSIWVPYNEQTEQTIREDFQRLWATSFLDDLSHRGQRLHLLQRRRRQARRLSHGGARARQDRQLRGQQADRSHEDRRAAARARHRAAPRLVRRRRRDPPHQDGAARDDGGEGLHQRRSSTTRSRRWPAGRSW